MLDNKYTEITTALFKENFSGNSGYLFLPQCAISRKFKSSIERIAKLNGELFLSEAVIITEPLSPLAISAIERIARRHGYVVACKNELKQLQYLGSDGGGHYSTDYYHFLRYGYILVTLPKMRKGA